MRFPRPDSVDASLRSSQFPAVLIHLARVPPFSFKNHAVEITLKGGPRRPPVDEFFNLYAGGLIGMERVLGPPDLGNELATIGLAYRFPIASSRTSGPLDNGIDKLYASIYGDAGNTWTAGATNATEPYPAEKKISDAGIELRLESYSWVRAANENLFQYIVRAHPVPAYDSEQP